MMSRIFSVATVLAALLSTGMAVAADDGSQITPAEEAAYTKLAARVVATADACTALEIISPGIGFLDEIDVGMMSFGAEEAEVEEWRSNEIARHTDAIQIVLKAEDKDAAWLECTKGIDEQRKTLAAILRGDNTDESVIDNGSAPPTTDTETDQ